MAKKLTIQEMQHIAQTRGGRCLSPVYINSSTHLTWECSCGNVWEAIPNNVKNGTWCPRCKTKKMWSNRKRPTIKDLQQLAIRKSVLLLSSSYENCKTKYVWQCLNGHKFNATYSNIKMGRGCPYCHRFVKEEQCRFIFNQLTGEEFPRRRLDGYELDGYCSSLSLAFEYQGEHHYRNTRWTKGADGLKKQQKRDQDKVLYCVAQEINLIVIPYFQANSPIDLENYIKKCLIDCCSFVSDKVNWDDFVGKSGELRALRDICKRKRITCLSTTYYDSYTKMSFSCDVCKRVWKTVSGSIKNGTGCPRCADRRTSIKNTHYDQQSILRLREEGKCYREISEQIGCALSTAHYVCSKSNFEEK